MTVNALSKEEVIYELNAFCGNADLSADVVLSDAKGGFWMSYNHSISKAYGKVGYSFLNNRFELSNRVLDDIQTKTAAGSMTEGTSYHLDLKVRETEEGKKVYFYVNGVLVMSDLDSADYRGKVGFVLSDCIATFSNITFRGDAKPLLGVTDKPLIGTITLDMIETDSDIIMTNGGGGYRTADGGKTWSKYSAKGMTDYNMVQLKDTGDLVSFKRISQTGTNSSGEEITEYNYACAISYDDGQTWTTLVDAVMDEWLPGRLSMNNRLTQGAMSGRLYFVTSETNNEAAGVFAIWTSEDNGASWKRTGYFDADAEGYCIQEGVVCEAADGTARCYFRNDLGMLCYYLSPDGGKTWSDMTAYPTPFISSMTCFNVEVDPEDGAMYLAWGHDNTNLNGQAQFPRTRWSIAKSTDNGHSWEWLGTAHENNNIVFNMMNLCINVSKDYLILQCFSDNEFDTTNWYSRMVVMPKDTQVTTKKFERVHMLNADALDNTLVMNKSRQDRVMAMHPSTGAVLLDGNLIEGAASGTKLSLGVGADFVGATLSAGSNSAWNLTYGGATVTFSASEVTLVNGIPYVEVSTFANKFGMSVIDRSGTKLISRLSAITARQGSVFRYGLDLFTNSIN